MLGESDEDDKCIIEYVDEQFFYISSFAAFDFVGGSGAGT